MSWDGELERVRADFVEVTVVEHPDGARWVEIGNLELPPGWEPARSRIAIAVPSDFPQTKPNGFFVEPGLTAPPGFPAPPPSGEQRHERNWAHVCYQHQTWVPEREDLWRYVKAMLRWFAEVR